uniref:peptidylprolyl isomerase n=1 Tax=Xiphophorus couchianus TaxID=32473 RepID=A0A3B5MT69_9TELE
SKLYVFTATVTVTYKPEECDKQTKKGDFIKYHYNGTLLDGTPIDSTNFRNQDYGKTYNIVLGANQVVPGMENGLMDMCVGEKRRLLIPPHLAYGERGVSKCCKKSSKYSCTSQFNTIN